MEKIIGILHTENLTIHAEAYDVDLKIEPGTNYKTLNILSV